MPVYLYIYFDSHVNMCLYCHCSRLNRKAKYNLEKDLKDKFSALSIDKYNAELKNNTAGLQFQPDAAKIDAKWVHIVLSQAVL